MNSEEQASRSYMKLPSVVARVDDVPIQAFGRTFVVGVSPDFETNVVMQEGNRREQVKIKPKKSWEISENHLGSMVSWQPALPHMTFSPF